MSSAHLVDLAQPVAWLLVRVHRVHQRLRGPRPVPPRLVPARWRADRDLGLLDHLADPGLGREQSEVAIDRLGRDAERGHRGTAPAGTITSPAPAAWVRASPSFLAASSGKKNV